MAWGERSIAVGGNFLGTAITGDNVTIHHPPGELKRADQVDSPKGVVRLRATPSAGSLLISRDEQVGRVPARLKRGSGARALAITGLGGIGKSTLAEQYVSSRLRRYNPIWWIDAETPAQISHGLAELGRRLYPDLAHAADAHAAEWGRNWLAAHKGWLVVLDNVRGPGDVAELITACRNGRFLVTSRHTTDWEGIATPTQLGVLPLHKATAMLRLRVRDEILLDDAGALCQALGGLPLAIDLAGRYLMQNHVSAATYLQRLSQPGANILAWRQAGEEPGPAVATVWDATLDRIASHHGQLPGRILGVVSWYAPGDLPADVLRYEDLGAEDQAAVDEAIGRLVAYGLMARSGDALHVHSLLQAITRERGDETGSNSLRELAGRVLLSAWKAADRSQRSRLLPHVAAHIHHGGPCSGDAEYAWMVIHYTEHMDRVGTADDQVRVLASILDETVPLLGADHRAVLPYRLALADAQARAGSTSDITSQLEDLIADQTRVLGPNHCETLWSTLTLAKIYQRNTSHLHQAITLLHRVAADAHRTLGPGDWTTLTARWELADCYASLADAATSPKAYTSLLLALAYYRVVLSDAAQTLGHDDPLTYAYTHRFMEFWGGRKLVALDDPICRRVLAFSQGAAGGKRLDRIRRAHELRYRRPR
ncbi:NB-ARC domain-containing protein [Streptomyces sp. TLI_55]|uniref:NB-ARC domain-containing protein n=1 Tax=Streptomyces sp. TLI_55 TaxID=1938861 RepID=UPI000BE48772|nr:NB-ARC domain-containing protein [Streptomyces sp. TLI_55]